MQVGAFEVLSAHSIVVEDFDPKQLGRQIRWTGETLRAWIAEKPIEAQDLLKRLRSLSRMFTLVQPEGDVLPHRVQDGKHLVTVVGPLASSRRIPYVALDLVSAYLATGRVPRIARAWRMVPRSRVRLQPFPLPDGTHVDPNHEDPFLAVATLRLRLAQSADLSDEDRQRWRGWAKLASNAACFGVLVQTNDVAQRRGRVFTPEGEELSRMVREEPGTWYFPPVATGVTAMARLLLHLVILKIEALGGTVAYVDTDGVFAVSTLEGDLIACPGGSHRLPDGTAAIHALSFAEVEMVREAMEVFSPYPPELGPYAYGWED